MPEMFEYDGINILEIEFEDLGPCDLHCPNISGYHNKRKKLNFWKSRCEERQKTRSSDCHGGCPYIKSVNNHPLRKQVDISIARNNISNIIELDKQGLTPLEISKEIGISRTTVYRYLRIYRED